MRKSLFFIDSVPEYDIPYSCIFNGTNEYMHRTPGTPGDRKKWTFSTWVKRDTAGTSQTLLGCGADGVEDTFVRFTNDNLDFLVRDNSIIRGRLVSNATYTDTADFHNVVVVYDSGNGTAGDRMLMFYDGVEITSFSTDTNPSLDLDGVVNSTAQHFISKLRGNVTQHLDGKLADTYLIDGQALDADSFGVDDGGTWVPIEYAGVTSGQNTFKQDYANSAVLGEDAINSNDFTTVNMDSGNQSTDTPTS
ncbi:hypothetical protein KAR91_53635 [Candidatus Pacearchaeota archaeon]|nr:hypothetical protein [Candidatus Pacearchaeota archaeon]